MNLDLKVVAWLLEGDPAIRYHTFRDIVEADRQTISREQGKIPTQGWGAQLLHQQSANGMWGNGLYTPKWTSTTYTMLLLRRLGLETCNPQVYKSCLLLLNKGFYKDGGINFFTSYDHSETCVTGLLLSILAYFEFEDERVTHLVDYLLSQQMGDGGWNCQSYKGATHSSFHTTINVLEGLREYEKMKITMDRKVKESQDRGREFLLEHRLFRSHRSGQIVDPKMTRFSFPPRWRYDVMRALDYFQESSVAYDQRMQDALELIVHKRTSDGKWNLQQRHAGRVFFELEPVGKPSRWNTLRALRILKRYQDDYTTD